MNYVLLYLQWSYPKFLIFITKRLHLHVLKECTCILANLLICRHKRQIGIEPRRFLVVVACSKLRNILHSVRCVSCYRTDFRVHFVVLKTIYNIAASWFESLWPLDVVKLIESCPELEKCCNIFAVFGCWYQSFCKLWVACKAI